MLLKCKQIDQRLSCTDWFFVFVFCPCKCWHSTSIALHLYYASKTFVFQSFMLKCNPISFLDNWDFSSSTRLIQVCICETNWKHKVCKISTLLKSIGETPYGHHAPPIWSFVDFGPFHNGHLLTYKKVHCHSFFKSSTSSSFSLFPYVFFFS
jgi:hypothetical protein